MRNWIEMVLVYRTARGEIREAKLTPIDVVATWAFIAVLVWTVFW